MSGTRCLGLLFCLLANFGATAAVPEPIARWTFDGDARDSVGSLHGELQGDATVAGGRLVLNGNGSMRTLPLDKELAAKTFVVRVKADSVRPWGGGVMAVQTEGNTAQDLLSFNSDSFWSVSSQRVTKAYYEAFPEVTPAFVHLAVTFAPDGTLVLYRNGRRYGARYQLIPGLRTFGAGDARVLFGWPGNFTGEIEDAALYDRALTEAEVAELAGVGPVDEQELVVLGMATNQLTIEESTVGTMVVHRTGRLDQSVSATLELRAGSAEVAGEAADLYLGTGENPVMLTFLPGQTELPVRISARLDRWEEGPEAASLHLTTTGGAIVQGDSATITIIPWINRVQIGGQASELGPSHIQLRLESGLGGRIRVQTTAAGSATPGVDFLAIDKVVDLAGIPGATGQVPVSIPITVLRDARIEGDETIGIRVTPLSKYTEVNVEELLVPLQDEPVLVGIGEAPHDAVEVERVLHFSLFRVGALDSPDVFRVRYRVVGVNSGVDEPVYLAARPGIDFVAQEGVVEFGPGISQQFVEVNLLNDAEVDGPRGLSLELLGSPDFPDIPSLGQGFATTVIRDDEHASLQQEMVLQPLIPQLRNREELVKTLARPGGKSLVLLGERAVQLTSGGVPDLEFGHRTGWISAKTEGWSGSLPVPRQTPDGRLVFVAEGQSRIRRLQIDGTVDPTFGQGSGEVILADPIASVVQLFPDGSLALLVTKQPQVMDLIRLSADGQPDAHFNPYRISYGIWDKVPEVVFGPGDNFWVVDSNRMLKRLWINGSVDPAFTEREGIEGYLGSDGLGRTYFRRESQSVPLDETQGEVVRLLADGTLDAAYRLPTPSTWDDRVTSGEIYPDGSALLVRGRNAIVEFDPDGRERRGAAYEIDGSIASVHRRADGQMLASIHTAWGSSTANLEFDGSIDWITLPPLLDTPTEVWEWEFRESGSHLVRTLLQPATAKAGIGRSGLVSHQASVRLPFLRSGNSSQSATLRGRVYPLNAGQWDDGKALPFEVSFPSGFGEVTAELPIPREPQPSGIGNYLVRLEQATGVELSAFTECRLWVVGDGLLPPAGEHRMALPTGPDTPDIGWLLGWWNPDVFVPFRRSVVLDQNLVWSDSWGVPTEGPGPVRLLSVSTEGAPTMFFRLP